MLKHEIHAVYRTYLAIARAEKYAPSELGETVNFVAPYSKRVIGVFLLTQVNFQSDERIEKATEKFWHRDFEEMYQAGVLPAPASLANKLICSDLKLKFDALEKLEQFDSQGNLSYPRRTDFFVPLKKNGLIEKFLFYRILKEKIEPLENYDADRRAS